MQIRYAPKFTNKNLLSQRLCLSGSIYRESRYVSRVRSEREVEPSEKGREHSWYIDFFLKSFLNLGTIYDLIASLSVNLIYFAQPQIRVKPPKWAHVTSRSSFPSFASSWAGSSLSVNQRQVLTIPMLSGTGVSLSLQERAFHSQAHSRGWPRLWLWGEGQ